MTEKFLDELTNRIRGLKENIVPDFDDIIGDNEDEKAFADFIKLSIAVDQRMDKYEEKWHLYERREEYREKLIQKLKE